MLAPPPLLLPLHIRPDDHLRLTLRAWKKARETIQIGSSKNYVYGVNKKKQRERDENREENREEKRDDIEFTSSQGQCDQGTSWWAY
ncbi:unnamed protein product [Arabidopsis halleri]